MAFIFRHRRRKNGKIVFASTWSVRFRDPLSGKLLNFPGYADRQATKTLAERLYREACRFAEGLGPAPAVRRGSESLDAKRAAFKQTRLDAGRSPKHAELTDQRLRTLFVGCRWTMARDIDADAATRYLAERRATEPRFGMSSTNGYLTALKMFSRWVSAKTKTVDPLAGVKLLNAEADRRHKRRALSFDDLDRLLNATRESPRSFRGLSGIDRAELYQMSAWSGLRAGELARLDADHLDLNDAAPLVDISAEQKRRWEETLPLHLSLVPMLRRRAAESPRCLWPGTWLDKAAKMLSRDLAAAGLEYKSAKGFADFHALRKAFTSGLARVGASLMGAQKLTRHTDPKLTANIYAELGDSELARELSKLPAANVRHTSAHTQPPKRRIARRSKSRQSKSENTDEK